MSTQTFRVGHATHSDFRMLVELAVTQLGDLGSFAAMPAPAKPASDEEDSEPPFLLGMAYVTSNMERHWPGILNELHRRLPRVRWVGSVGHSICADAAEYVAEPALALMLTRLPSTQWAMFASLGNAARRASLTDVSGVLLHADPGSADLVESLEGFSKKVPGAQIFGGISSSSGQLSGPHTHVASQVVQGGVSGVLFGAGTRVLTRLTQGCRPFAKAHKVSASKANYLQALDGEPALDVMLADLGVDRRVRESRDGQTLLRALPTERLRSGLLIGIQPGEAAAAPDGFVPRGFGMSDFLVRNVVGIDPEQRVLALAAEVHEGDKVVFCTRDVDAAHTDLVRICAELRDEVEEQALHILGAHYVSCTARGANLFGAAGAELAIIRHNLGDVPLIGFHANGEIAGDKLYGYTGVLTLFLADQANPG